MFSLLPSLQNISVNSKRCLQSLSCSALLQMTNTVSLVECWFSLIFIIGTLCHIKPRTHSQPNQTNAVPLSLSPSHAPLEGYQRMNRCTGSFAISGAAQPPDTPTTDSTTHSEAYCRTITKTATTVTIVSRTSAPASDSLSWSSYQSRSPVAWYATTSRANSWTYNKTRINIHSFSQSQSPSPLSPLLVLLVSDVLHRTLVLVHYLPLDFLQ